MHTSVWIWILFTVIGQVITQIQNVTVCHTPQSCNFFNMTCQNGQRIQIKEAEYRYRSNQTCSGETCSNSCCPFDANDCRKHFSEFHATTLYQRCSGNKECIKQPAPVPPESVCNRTVGYIHMNYNCINENNFIDICNSKPIKNFSEVNIMLFNTTRSTDRVSRCTCLVQSKKTVYYQLVDVRFFVASTDNPNKYNCTSGTLNISGLVVKCNKTVNMFVYMESDHFNGTLKQKSDIIEFTYNQNDKPSMVWIHLKVLDGDFEINCTNESSTIVTTTPSAVVTTPSKSSTPASMVTTTASAVDTRPSKSSTPTSMVTTAESAMKTIPPESVINIGARDGVAQLSVILPAVGAVIMIIVGAVIILIVYRRRCRRPVERDHSKNDLPSGQINLGYETVNDSNMNNPDVETSNYDNINDESIETYSKPVKKNIEDIIVAKIKKKFDGDALNDEYDKIQFGKKCTRETPNYDSLRTKESNVQHDAYSHISSQSKPIFSVNTNEYSHCKISRTMFPSDDCTSKAMVSDQRVGDGDYSHFDLDVEWKKEMPSNVNKEAPYDQINFDKTTTFVGSDKAKMVGVIPETKNALTAFTDLQSSNEDGKCCFTCDVYTKVSSKESHFQGIKTLSLNDNNFEFEECNISDTPQSKEQQYAFVAKTRKEQKPDELDSRSKIKNGLENGTVDAKEIKVISDYELAKPFDL